MAAAPPALAQARDCPVAGLTIHWIADYCMSTLETDDEIPASSCINTEAGRSFANDCMAKLHYKQALCQLAISRRLRQDDVDNCVSDQEFAGPTVRNRGVGGG